MYTHTYSTFGGTALYITRYIPASLLSLLFVQYAMHRLRCQSGIKVDIHEYQHIPERLFERFYILENMEQSDTLWNIDTTVVHVTIKEYQYLSKT